MIAGLTGISLVQGGLNENEVIVRTSGGVDYLVKVSIIDRRDMVKMDNVSIWCSTRYSQDNGPVLWGGIDVSARRRFNNFLKIPRLSGKVAIELSHPSSFNLLQMRDAKRLAKAVSGLGEKMAQAIILNLDSIIDNCDGPDIAIVPTASSQHLSHDVRKDIVLAMKSLGFSGHEANEAVKLVEQQENAMNIDLATGIKIALQHVRPKVFEVKES